MTEEKNINFWKLPLYKIYTDDEDVNLITKIIKRGTNWALGPEIDEFENSIKNYLGVEYCVSMNSGTSSLHGTLLAYGIGNTDEVIIPSFSFIATANSVMLVNANPIFSDIEEKTFGLDPKKIVSKISEKTKAIMPMDYGGSPCDLLEIQKIAAEYNLLLIEDGAEALGSSINNKKIGSISDSTIFSFCGNKVLTTGEGGAVVTNSKKIYEKLRLIRSHGRIDDKSYFNNPDASTYLNVGYNWRMSSLTAAIGISQLAKLDKIIKMRQDNAHYISEKISKIPEIITPSTPKSHEHIFQMYSIRLSNKNIRDKLHDFLTKKRIFSKIYFTPIHMSTFYKSKFPNASGSLPITEKISDDILTLPLYPNMTKEEKDFLIQSIFEFFEKSDFN